MRSRFCAVYTVAVALGLGLALAGSPALAACDPETALFEDDFEFFDGSWGTPDDRVFAENGVMVISSFMGVVNFQTHNEAANVCVDTTIADAPVPDQSPIGLVWWWENWDNYYYLFYWSDAARVEVRRMNKGQSQTVVSVETLALKQGVGQTNQIELQLRPKDATLFINGTQVTRFKGKPPKGGAPIGFYGTSPEDKPGRFEFDNLVVSPASE
jgi:hypothetical protein